MQKFGVLVVGMLVGCTSGPEASSSSSAVTEVRIVRDADRVQILGLDARHSPLGEVVIRAGEYADIEALDPAPVQGRLLALRVEDVTVTHRAPGHEDLQLPIVASRHSPAFLAFITDAKIVAALEAEGVHARVVPSLEALLPPPTASLASGEEAAYAACTFGASTTGATACGTGDCFQFTGTPPIQHRCCQGSGEAVERMCTGIPATSGSGATCAGGSSSNPSTNSCGNVGCFGCSVCPGINTFTYVDWCIVDSNGQFWDQGVHCNGPGSQCTDSWQCCEGAGCVGPIGQKTCSTPP